MVKILSSEDILKIGGKAYFLIATGFFAKKCITWFFREQHPNENDIYEQYRTKDHLGPIRVIRTFSHSKEETEMLHKLVAYLKDNNVDESEYQVMSGRNVSLIV